MANPCNDEVLQNPEIAQDELKKGFYEDVKDADPSMRSQGQNRGGNNCS